MAALAREGVARGAMRLDWDGARLERRRRIRFYRRLGGRPQTEWLRYTLEETACARWRARSLPSVESGGSREGRRRRSGA